MLGTECCLLAFKDAQDGVLLLAFMALVGAFLAGKCTAAAAPAQLGTWLFCHSAF